MPEPLRVLFVMGSLGGGGAERRLVDLLANLDRRAVSPRLYLAYRRGELLPEVPADVPIDAFQDGETVRSPLQRLLAKLRCPSAARALHLREVIRTHPVNLVMSWTLLNSYEAALAGIGLPIPQIASIVVEPQAELADAFPRLPLVRRRLAAWTYRAARLVVVNSAELREQIIGFYRLNDRKVATWLNTRDFARIDRLAAEGTVDWPAAGRRIIAVGRLLPQKGFDLLLRAAARIHTPEAPVQVTILGQGPDEAALRRLAEDLGIAGQVRFLGFQANPFAYYRSADVFVLSSRFEGMPNALIEAVACRTPVVATDCPTGPREILDQGRFGRLVPVDDVAALATAIQSTFDAPPSTNELEAARQSVLDRFGIQTGIHKLLELFAQATSPSLAASRRTNLSTPPSGSPS